MSGKEQINPGFDQLNKGSIEGDYTGITDIENLKKEFDDKAKAWFDKDVGELKDILGGKKDDEIKEFVSGVEEQILAANDTIEMALSEADGEEGKLNEATKQELLKAFGVALDPFDKYVEQAQKIQEAQQKEKEVWDWDSDKPEEVDQAALETDDNPENPKYLALENEANKLSEDLDKKINSEMGGVLKAADFILSRKGISVKDMIKDPNNLFGGILRALLGIEVEEGVLEKVHNPFANIEVNDQEGESQIQFPEGLTFVEIQKESKDAANILKSMQNFSVCEGLELTKFEAKGKMEIKAKNWSQVVFLRKFLPHNHLPEKFLGEHMDELSSTLADNDKFGSLFEQQDEYLAEHKQDFPDLVHVKSKGFDLAVGWSDANLSWQAVQKVKEEKQKKEKKR